MALDTREHHRRLQMALSLAACSRVAMESLRRGKGQPDRLGEGHVLVRPTSTVQYRTAVNGGDVWSKNFADVPDATVTIQNDSVVELPCEKLTNDANRIVPGTTAT